MDVFVRVAVHVATTVSIFSSIASQLNGNCCE